MYTVHVFVAKSPDKNNTQNSLQNLDNNVLIHIVDGIVEIQFVKTPDFQIYSW